MPLRPVALAASLALAVAPVAAAGARGVDALLASCRTLDTGEFARCNLERRPGRWTLTTHVVLDGGSRQQMAALERHFCAAARARGVEGRVRRWQRVFAVPDGAALAEWSCALPAVSQGPLRR